MANTGYVNAATPRLKRIDPTRDRVVRFNGDIIARIYENSVGPGKSRWNYFVQWYSKGGLDGDAVSLNDALALVKELHIRAGQPPSVASGTCRGRLIAKKSVRLI